MSQKKSKRDELRQQHATNQLPILLIAGGVLLVGIVAFAVWQAAGGNSGPKVPVEVNGVPSIKIDKEKVDLGDVPLGQTVEVAFNISNVGNRQLRFTETPYIELVEGC
ncbi:MAG: DUF1573 domain-containing protein [Chloroflexi bacterium]|nr:DUF1573 domain-containing protein [Chloroflexota bacterium]